VIVSDIYILVVMIYSKDSTIMNLEIGSSFNRYISVNLLFLCLGFYATLSAQDAGDRLFDNSFLHEIKITSESEDQLWEAITREYVSVNMTIDGHTLDSIGLRLKGSTSASDIQKPLQVDVNAYVMGRKYDGLKKFGLRNNYKDSFLQKEKVAYEVYRRAGLASPRSSYAEVYIDGIFRGVYSITEAIDKTFLDHNFPSDDGSLYKGVFGARGFSVEVKEGTMEEFDSFKKNLKSTTLGDLVDLNAYLKQLATDIIVGDWDSYAYYRHNYYIYYETKSERYYFINWDHNFAFSVDPRSDDIYPIGTYPALNNMIDNPNLRVRYEETMCELLTYLLDSDYISDITSHNYKIISTSRHSISIEEPADLVAYITKRKRWLQDTLKSLGVTCQDISYAHDDGDILINELATSHDYISDLKSADRDRSDWIELYNSTSSDITLDRHYYLSDDKDFPKKWNFNSEMVIPARGYLTVWADKDIQKEGAHAGFKLDGDGGDLVMTFEDLTEIQNINYGPQIPNVSYARFPNGGADFIMQQPTFESANSNLIPIELSSNLDIDVYLCPYGEYILMDTDRPVKEVTVLDEVDTELRKFIDPIFPLHLNDLSSGVYTLDVVLGEESFKVKVERD